jgi:hypothetical protein
MLSALATKVRMFSASQVARGFFPNSQTPSQDAARVLHKLERAGLIEIREFLAGPEVVLNEPLWVWHPGEPPPPFREISREARARWNETPRPEPVAVLTKNARRLLGGTARKSGAVKPLQARHDLHLAAVYTHYRASSPEVAERWIGEDVIAPGLVPSGRIPDAVLLARRDAGIERVIEFIGSYTPERVAEFCEWAMTHNLPFELW